MNIEINEIKSNLCTQCHKNNVFMTMHSNRCLTCIYYPNPVPELTSLQNKLKQSYARSAGNYNFRTPCTKCHQVIVANIQPSYKLMYPKSNKKFIKPKFGNNLCFECVLVLAGENSDFFID